MCTEITLLNASLLIKTQDLDHIRRLLKKGEKIYLLNQKEKESFKNVNFNPEDYNTIKKEFTLASEISGIPVLDITGIGISENILSIRTKKQM